MPQPMDAVTSFSHLTTNLPEWILQIDNLSAHAVEKHGEFAAEYSRLLQTARPKRTKSASIASIHSTRDKATERECLSTGEDATSPPLEFPEISPFEAGNRYLYAQARRKRKPTSSVRSAASGPQKFRSKQSVVIYYDSFLQEQLDTMVKNIASARNNIRKGKLSRSLQQGLQLPSFSRQFPQTYTSSSSGLLALPHVRSTMSLPTDTTRTVIRIQTPANDACFFQADKELESAQSLCETAAHQFLRDGDCKVELEGAKAKFQGLLALATDALDKFRAERQSEEEHREEEEVARTDSEATLCEKPSQELIAAKLAPGLTQYPSQPALNLVMPGALEIEVDEDDSSSIDVDISKFRSARATGGRMGLRSHR